MDIFEKWDKENGLIPDDMLYHDGSGNTFTQSEIDEMICKNESFIASEINMSALARWSELKNLAMSLKGKELTREVEFTVPEPRNPFASAYIRGFTTHTPQPLGKEVFRMCQIADVCDWAETPKGITMNFLVKIYS